MASIPALISRAATLTVGAAVATVSLTGGVAAGATTPAPTTHIAAATATTTAPTVTILKAHAVIGSDGGVQISFKSRCPSGFQAFELDVSVSQPGAQGFTFQLAPPVVVPCDGTFHTTTVTVYPSQGTFQPGVATVDLFVGFYDPVQGSDTEATDSTRVRLRMR